MAQLDPLIDGPKLPKKSGPFDQVSFMPTYYPIPSDRINSYEKLKQMNQSQPILPRSPIETMGPVFESNYATERAK